MMTRFSFFFFALFLSFSVIAQTNGLDTLAPYQKNDQLPAFNLKKLDGSWYNVSNLNKDKNVAFIVFNPDCHHCEIEAEEISKNIEELQNIEFLWVTTSTEKEEIEKFAQRYNFLNKENFHFLTDPNYAAAIFYEVRTTPFMAIYNKQGKLKKIYRNATTAAGILQALK